MKRADRKLVRKLAQQQYKSAMKSEQPSNGIANIAVMNSYSRVALKVESHRAFCSQDIVDVNFQEKGV